MKIVDSTQTMRKSLVKLVKHISARGIPTRPDNKSDVAKEARNMLVGVLSVFFLWIKMITKPFTALISRHMKDNITVSGQGKKVSSYSVSEDSFRESLTLQLELRTLNASITWKMKNPWTPFCVLNHLGEQIRLFLEIADTWLLSTNVKANQKLY